MPFLSKKWSASFLILLFIGSFILHPLIHDSGSCVHESFSGIQLTGNVRTAPHSDHIRPVEQVCVSSDFFCPVCAGWLTADCPERTGFTPVCRNSQPEIAAADDSAAAPDCRLPSPRAPPAA